MKKVHEQYKREESSVVSRILYIQVDMNKKNQIISKLYSLFILVCL